MLLEPGSTFSADTQSPEPESRKPRAGARGPVWMLLETGSTFSAPDTRSPQPELQSRKPKAYSWSPRMFGCCSRAQRLASPALEAQSPKAESRKPKARSPVRMLLEPGSTFSAHHTRSPQPEPRKLKADSLLLVAAEVPVLLEGRTSLLNS